MNKDNFDQYKKLLLLKKEETQTGLESLNDSARPVDLNAPIGRLSRQDAMLHQQMALNAKKQAELTLNLINQAIKRINNDDYGYCLRCENEIAHKRLLAKPEATFCTDCQT